MMESP